MYVNFLQPYTNAGETWRYYILASIFRLCGISQNVPKEIVAKGLDDHCSPLPLPKDLCLHVSWVMCIRHSKIFTYIPADSLLRISSTSKSWKDYATSALHRRLHSNIHNFVSNLLSMFRSSVANITYISRQDKKQTYSYIVQWSFCWRLAQFPHHPF